MSRVVAIVECPDCGTTTAVDPERAAAAIDQHNQRAHDGYRTARLLRHDLREE